MDKTILVVDSDPSVREQVAAVLSERGYRVLQAGTVAEASLIEAREPLHLLLVDDELPDGDGVEWIARLRAAGNHLRVIFTSPPLLDSQRVARLYRQLHVSMVLDKPVAPTHLGELIEGLIGKARPKGQRHPALDNTLSMLRKEYLLRLPGRLSDLSRAVAAARERPGDPAALLLAEGQAHRIRGTAGTFGLLELGEASRRMETALREARIGTEGLYGEIDRSLAAIRRLATEGGFPYPGSPGPSAEPAEPSPDHAGASVPSAADDPHPGEPAAARLPVNIEMARVLLLDEDEELQATAAKAARQRLIEVVPARTPAEALAACRERPPDAALLSLDLSEGGAERTFQLSRQIRALPLCESLPLAFLSQGPAHQVSASHRGASLYLVKPLSAETFLLAVDQLVAANRDARPSVLLVDDDEEFASLVAGILRCEGMTVALLRDPARVLATLGEVHPDLLLLDVNMPGISGFDLCRVLRATLEWQALPIVFLTGETDLSSRLVAFQAGGDDYLVKPILKEELLARIKVRIERARLLRERAERDALTGLLLRRSFLEGFSVRLQAARRKERALSLCILDLDRFKDVNDTHGHLAGDRVLAALGNLLSRRLRQEDLRGRWGGEEFVLALPDTGADAAAALLSRVLDEFRKVVFAPDRGEPFRTSFSGGVACFPEDGQDVDALLRAADRRLYRAKAGGRCQVQVHGPTPESVG